MNQTTQWNNNRLFFLQWQISDGKLRMRWNCFQERPTATLLCCIMAAAFGCCGYWFLTRKTTNVSRYCRVRSVVWSHRGGPYNFRNPYSSKATLGSPRSVRAWEQCDRLRQGTMTRARRWEKEREREADRRSAETTGECLSWNWFVAFLASIVPCDTCCGLAPIKPCCCATRQSRRLDPIAIARKYPRAAALHFTGRCFSVSRTRIRDRELDVDRRDRSFVDRVQAYALAN